MKSCGAVMGAGLALLHSFYFWVPPVSAVLVNRTIDDSFGDSVTGALPKYLPTTAGVWKNQACEDCWLKPDAGQAFKGTFTSATYRKSPVSIQLDFTGTAIWVYFVLSGNAQKTGAYTTTAANFSMDGGAKSSFLHDGSKPVGFLYNQLVYARTDMVNASHRLLISVSDRPASSWVNFDYAIYMKDDGSPNPPVPGPSSSNLPPSTTIPSPQGPGGAPNVSSPSTSLPRSSDKGSSLTASSDVTQSTNSPSADSNTVNPPIDGSGSPEHKSSPTAAIAGAVAGGAALLLILLAVCLVRRRRRRQNSGFDYPLATSTLDNVRTGPRYPSVSPFNVQPPFDSPRGKEAELLPHYHDTQSDMASHSRRQLLHVIGSVAPTTPSVYDNADSQESMYTDRERLLSTGEDLRRQRQDELELQMQAIQREMASLASQASPASLSREALLSPVRRSSQQIDQRNMGHEDDETSTKLLRERVREMEGQIAYLDRQRQSAWAQGLSDDPPPGYTPPATSVPVPRFPHAS